MPWLETTIVQLDEFVDRDEPGAQAVLGDADEILIPEGGDVMIFGDGGAGKTTLSIDLVCHLAAGDSWLTIPVPRPVRVLIIENEGPRPHFRKKLRRKREAWNGSAFGDRVDVFENPWGRFDLSESDWRLRLAEEVRQREVDVVVAGPLTRIGMDEKGTLQEVATFMRLVSDVRERCRRLLTLVLIHHENKTGAVSGAWEGAGDTMLHVQAAGNGHTVVKIQKARWDSGRHGKTLKLAWAEGESFELEGDRDYRAEIKELLTEHAWLTAKEISASNEESGIGANVDKVRAILDNDPETFESRTGEAAKELGRHPNAIVWNLRDSSRQATQRSEPPKSPRQKRDRLGERGSTADSDSRLRESAVSSRSPSPQSVLTQPVESPRSASDLDDLEPPLVEDG